MEFTAENLRQISYSARQETAEEIAKAVLSFIRKEIPKQAKNGFFSFEFCYITDNCLPDYIGKIDKSEVPIIALADTVLLLVTEELKPLGFKVKGSCFRTKYYLEVSWA